MSSGRRFRLLPTVVTRTRIRRKRPSSARPRIFLNDDGLSSPFRSRRREAVVCVLVHALRVVYDRSPTTPLRARLQKLKMKRYYTPSLDRGLLDTEQSHHCAQVMRQGVGDLFAVFDGHGAEAKARITEIARDQVRFQILAKASSPRPAHPVWLAQALTTAKSMDLIIEKATELGVS